MTESEEWAECLRAYRAGELPELRPEPATATPTQPPPAFIDDLPLFADTESATIPF